MKKWLSVRKDAALIVIGATVYSIIMVLVYYASNISAAVMSMLLAVVLLLLWKRVLGVLLNPAGIFGFFWFFAVGLACLQLHQYQLNWKVETWLCITITYLAFVIGYVFRSNKPREKKNKRDNKVMTKNSFLCYIVLLSSIVCLALAIEAIVRKGLPVFSKNMSSYMNFGVTGIHYFTVCSCLVLPASIIFVKFFKRDMTKLNWFIILVCNVAMLAVPVLIVSRQLILITIILGAVTLLYLQPKWTMAVIILSLAVGIGGWLAIGSQRNQNDNYLRAALRIQDDSILSTKEMQVYMYIACNFDNLDKNIGEIKEYTYGKRVLFPMFALTGLKFAMDIPNLTDDTGLKRITPTFNTYSLPLTPYMDFGLIGVTVYMFIIGLVCGFIDRLNKKNPFSILVWAIMIYCLATSFFGNSFASPTIWFYAIILILANLILAKGRILPDAK